LRSLGMDVPRLSLRFRASAAALGTRGR
jgi:hypothetical protein